MSALRFVDLFAGIGGFHLALKDLGHECVFASELNDELQQLYRKNFPESHGLIHGDIRETKKKIPAHDLLCAGFPCQPFSKSGAQRGLRDRTRGTLFHEVLDVLRTHRPQYVLLENVGNFERHDKGRTWTIVREELERLGYVVRGTEHITSGGIGLVSPHHLGFPHTRERFFVVGSRSGLPTEPFPPPQRARATTLVPIVQQHLSSEEARETSLTLLQRECIDFWNGFIQGLPASEPLPSFPIWGDEFAATYPFETRTPFTCSRTELRRFVAPHSQVDPSASKNDLLGLLPSYARVEENQFPAWKIRFIRQNRDWFSRVRHSVPRGWYRSLRHFPPSLRKLEWNCQGEARDLWRHVLQFRPSGLRVKRFTTCPALVAMTTTQIPILGPLQRFLTRKEGLLLQGFPESHALPASRTSAFAALGNAVHVGVVTEIVRRLTEHNSPQGHMEVLRDGR